MLTLGLPKEIKNHEYRVAMLPVGVHLAVEAGHRVLVQKGAGLGSGYSDEAYVDAGAVLVDTAEEVFAGAGMIVKVKEPQKQEIAMLRQGQVLFTYLHLAADKAQAEGLLASGATAVAYETLLDRNNRLPLLTPMSEIAGRMAVQEGAKYLEIPQHGRGILLGGVPGVEPARVLVLGGGVVGTQAAKIAAGTGADVTIMDISLDRLRYLDDVMPANVKTVYSDPHAIADHARRADLVIGAVLIPGAKAPSLIRKSFLKEMLPGAVIVDVAVDQGGCFETTRATTHENPTYIVDGVVHYCVANMPGAVGRTSTQALCHATQPYVLKLAEAVAQGHQERLFKADRSFNTALNIHAGRVTHPEVAHCFGMELDGRFAI